MDDEKINSGDIVDREEKIDKVIEALNEEKLNDEEFNKITNEVKTKQEGDIEKENRERLDDDLQENKMPQQEPELDEKQDKIQQIIKMLNALDLSEQEMARLENEVERTNGEKTEEKDEKEKESGR